MKQFEIEYYGKKYTLQAVTAIADCDNEDESKRQECILVTDDDGEQHIVFTFTVDMDEDKEALFAAMCDEPMAWEGDVEAAHIKEV